MPRKPPVKVLVVARKESVQGLLQDLLEPAGYLVSLAGNEEEAFLMIKQEMSQDRAYDLIVAEHPAPFLKGLRLVRRLKKDHPSLRVILITFEKEDVTSTALAAGADGTLRGPLDLNLLRPMVRQMAALAGSA